MTGDFFVQFFGIEAVRGFALSPRRVTIDLYVYLRVDVTKGSRTMKTKLRKFMRRYGEQWRYLIVGIGTTVINYVL